MNPYINNVSWGISLVLRQTASKQVTLKLQFPPQYFYLPEARFCTITSEIDSEIILLNFLSVLAFAH